MSDECRKAFEERLGKEIVDWFWRATFEDGAGEIVQTIMKMIPESAWSARGDGWVSVKERLPSKKQDVLASGHEYDNPDNPRWQIVSRFDDGKFQQWSDDIATDGGGYWSGDCYVTHWQPLPEPPKGEE